MKALVIVAVALSIACGGPRYSVIVQNGTPAEVLDAHVSYGDFSSLSAPLRPGGHTGHHFIQVPIPDRATVSWRTNDGTQHHQEVAVKSLLPPDFSGDINFEIGETGVRVWAEAR